MPYRLAPDVPLVIAKDRQGNLCYHYAQPQPKGRDFGPIIEWLSDGQRDYLLRRGMVEELDADQAANLLRIGTAEPIDDDLEADTAQPHGQHGQDRVNALIAILDDLGVPAEAGAPKAREALRDAHHSAPNSLIAAAIKLRKAALSETAAHQ